MKFKYEEISYRLLLRLKKKIIKGVFNAMVLQNFYINSFELKSINDRIQLYFWKLYWCTLTGFVKNKIRYRLVEGQIKVRLN